MNNIQRKYEKETYNKSDKKWKKEKKQQKRMQVWMKNNIFFEIIMRIKKRTKREEIKALFIFWSETNKKW